MQSLRFKQRVKDVQSKVFKRRSTSDCATPTDETRDAAQQLDADRSSLRGLKKPPSITSLRLLRKSFAASKDDRGSEEVVRTGSAESPPPTRNGKPRTPEELHHENSNPVVPGSQPSHQSAPAPATAIAAAPATTAVAPAVEPPCSSQATPLPPPDPDPPSPTSAPVTPLPSPGILSAPPLPPPTTSAVPARSQSVKSITPALAHIPETHPPESSADDTSIVQRSDSTASALSFGAINRRPSQFVRRQSLLPKTESKLIQSLLNPDSTNRAGLSEESGGPAERSLGDTSAYNSAPGVMVQRKIWIKRPGASSTAISVGADDLVDDARDAILRKYQNSLGRGYDAPDIHLRIIPRGALRSRAEHQRFQGERMLSPDEVILQAIDDYYPGGQSAEEALIIEVPQKRTPRPSPGHSHSYAYGATEAHNESNDYFSAPVQQGGGLGTQSPSMSVITTGHVPSIPGSPGRRTHGRPGLSRRVNTSSPTMHSSASSTVGTTGPVVMMPRQNRSRGGSDASPPGQLTPNSPKTAVAGSDENSPRKVATPPPVRVGSPPSAATKAAQKKERRNQQKPNNQDSNQNGAQNQNEQRTTNASHNPSAAMHPDHAVPPIKVLIVEDNIINLRLLEAFMKRLRVRWEAAINGKIAVEKWRAGGFHLVLMDIQLPVMNGLEATKEIRRLERINKIGAFLHTRLEDDEEPVPDEIPEKDRLPDSLLFRSPVIIVALTASSLQSDRHEAYAAGCNDFLTKPVNFIWLERKVTEWGCMQALIDFDGWKKWKEISEAEKAAAEEAVNRKKAGKKPAPASVSTNGRATPVASATNAVK